MCVYDFLNSATTLSEKCEQNDRSTRHSFGHLLNKFSMHSTVKLELPSKSNCSRSGKLVAIEVISSGFESRQVVRNNFFSFLQDLTNIPSVEIFLREGVHPKSISISSVHPDSSDRPPAEMLLRHKSRAFKEGQLAAN